MELRGREECKLEGKQEVLERLVQVLGEEGRTRVFAIRKRVRGREYEYAAIRIPEVVRRLAGLKPGDEVRIRPEIRNGRIVLVIEKVEG